MKMIDKGRGLKIKFDRRGAGKASTEAKPKAEKQGALAGFVV